jgi:hypothetical protein
VFLASLFLFMALLVCALVVYHMPPQLFGFAYLVLLVVAFLVAKNFIARRQGSSEQRAERSEQGPLDEATRRRLRQGLRSAKLFLALFTLGLLVFMVKVLTDSLKISWWMKLECVVIGLLSWFWAFRQIINFKKKLGRP